jgi:hypothetical protein
MPGTFAWHFLLLLIYLSITEISFLIEFIPNNYMHSKSIVHPPLFFLLLLFVTSQLPSFSQPPSLFTNLKPEQTGIGFQNKIVESAGVNIITYEYFYNGGGVGAGDFNNDGLIDLYFTGNMSPNKLYLNKANMKFEDITKISGAGGKPGWKTGVSVADVNGDGFLDIYVCYSGDLDSTQRANQLFINNGNLTFTDKATEMGVDDMGYSTHAAFFDMDRDGDLDLYVLNHNIKNLRNFDAAFVKKMVDPNAGDRLYENKEGKFSDISRKAGIISNPLGYGLGINIADINNDGWPDIYVSNDYVEEDYLYINNKNGTFTESMKSSFGHLSNFSMGVDIADINNDGLMDIFTLDMLPEDNKRQKLLYAPDNYELYNNTLSNGFYHQLMRNMLQLNNGNGTFSEIGQLSGISNTDWSWAALFADFNHDGTKDLFVTNGYGRDMINRDFMKFYANERLKHLQGKTDSRMFQMLQGIQSTPLHNYIFENNGNLQFKDRSIDWGFDEVNFSHGAVYADLDNDGDLDLVMNRMNQEAGLYQNMTIENNAVGHFLNINLKASGNNTFAIGATVSLHAANNVYTMQNFPVHGFQSSMQVPIHFGFKENKIDSITIKWSNGQHEVILNPSQINGTLDVVQLEKTAKPLPINKAITPIFTSTDFKLSYKHYEDLVNDFKIQPLMPNMFSYSGPRLVKGDVNNDKLDDIYVCGPKDQPGTLFIQQRDGSYKEDQQKAFNEDASAEDCGALFFDADNDGDLDLYVVSGGFVLDDEQNLQDRLYFNKNGKFTKQLDLLPKETISGSQVIAMDYDDDGDEDLFVSGRVVPGKYPVSPSSMLLENNGQGKFSDKTSLIAEFFLSPGMITDAKWADINDDKKKELIISGEWMSLMVFSYQHDKFKDISNQVFSKTYSGWWNRMELADLDKDGDLDLIAGNWGTNSQLKASDSTPVTLYYGDFDNNGYIDPLLCYYIQGKSYPMASRDEITDQMVSLRQKFPTYDSYADAALEDILTEDQLKNAKILSANFLQTAWFENVNGKFVMHQFPIEADFSVVQAIYIDDFNHDGFTDILLAGNADQMRIKIGKMDANFGTVLAGDGKGNFKYINQVESGLNVKGCVRDIIEVSNKGGVKTLMMGLNNQSPEFIKY